MESFKTSIHLKTIQTVDNHRDEIINTYEGIYTTLSNMYVLKFEETDPDLGEKLNTLIKIKNDEVQIIRNGYINSKFIFKQGHYHTSLYTSPFGQMNLKITTKKLSVLIFENTLYVTLKYALFTDGSHLSDNEIKLNFKLK